MSSWPLLSLVVLTPWAGAALLGLRPALGDRASRWLGLAFSLSTAVLGAVLLAAFDPSRTGLQFVERHAWIRSLNVHYHLGLDGLSLVLVLLTAAVAPAAQLSGWGRAGPARVPTLLLLLLQGAALGVFLAQDFFPWFTCWELSLVPAYFLIRLWGGAGATRAAYQFVIYTIGGSAFLLAGFAALFAATGTFDFGQLAQLGRDGGLSAQLGPWGVWAVFAGVLLGLAVKVPLWPFHTWLPPAYAAAPTGTVMLLTGVLSKMGMYGFLRLLWPLFPAQLHAAAPALLALAVAGIALGAWAALRQEDLRRMLAYSSLNHLGYCLAALFAVAAATGGERPAAEPAAAALAGLVLQLFNHGVTAAALFLCAGILEARAGGRSGLGDFGGLRATAPAFAALAGVAFFASLGLPGLSGFVGEFLIFRGLFGLQPAAAVLALPGLLATAQFLLTAWRRVFHGPVQGASADFAPLTAAEGTALALLTGLMVVPGLAPALLTSLTHPLVTAWAGHLTP